MIPQLNTAKIAWAFKRAMKGAGGDLKSLAVREWMVCPTQRQKSRPAISLDGWRDRVIALSPWRNWAEEENLINGGEITHSGTIGYELADVRISGPMLYCGATRSERGVGRDNWVVDREPLTRMDSAHLVGDWTGSRFFGNFMREHFTLSLIPDAGAPQILLPTNPYEHVDDYRALFATQKPETVTNGIVKRLTIYSDYGQTDYKCQRYETLRSRLRANTGPGAGCKMVYLKRGSTGENRILENEEILEDCLRKQGFEIVEPSQMSVAEIVDRLLDARIVVSVEGSHITHAYYTMADDGLLVVLQPPNRFAVGHKEYCDLFSITFAFVVGSPSENGFVVKLDEINQVIEKAGF